MDENNRITITVCGDGGCGMRHVPGGLKDRMLIHAQEKVQSHYGLSEVNGHLSKFCRHATVHVFLGKGESALANIHSARYDPTIGTAPPSLRPRLPQPRDATLNLHMN